jgi:flavin reductase (DIM6/NTAB) family NADH-FMN oxidoreductase RutF
MAATKTYIMSEMAVRDCYQLMTRVIAPRPIAFVSTLDAEGRGNLAPFSFFMAGGGNPPSCVICPALDRHGQPKDTLRNIEATGEYVISIVTQAIVAAANETSWSYEPGVDEFDVAGLTRRASTLVAPPGVLESPINLECKAHQVVAHGDGALASRYVVGEILAGHVDTRVLTDGWPDPAKTGQVGRCGLSYYARASGENLFTLERPTGPKGR